MRAAPPFLLHALTLAFALVFFLALAAVPSHCELEPHAASGAGAPSIHHKYAHVEAARAGANAGAGHAGNTPGGSSGLGPGPGAGDVVDAGGFTMPANAEGEEELDATAAQQRASSLRRSGRKASPLQPASGGAPDGDLQLLAVSLRWLGLLVTATLVPFRLALRLVLYLLVRSYRTCKWMLMHALRPVRIGLAPVVYLLQGAAQVFILAPARGIQRIARELYPLYVFTGAALAVGTTLGAAAGITMLVGSWIFSSGSISSTSSSSAATRTSNQRKKVDGPSSQRKEQRAALRRERLGVLDGSLKGLERIHLPGPDDSPPPSESDADEDTPLRETDNSMLGQMTSKIKRASGDVLSSGGWDTGAGGVSSPSASTAQQQHAHLSSAHLPAHHPVGATGRRGWGGRGSLASPSSSSTSSARFGPSMSATTPPPGSLYPPGSSFANSFATRGAFGSPWGSAANSPLTSPEASRQPGSASVGGGYLGAGSSGAPGQSSVVRQRRGLYGPVAQTVE